MTEPKYSKENPHPLFNRKTELIWEGKYDEFGNRREVDIAGCAFPMQKIETIDQPRSEAAAKGQKELDLFQKTTKRKDDFRNKLIWGDNKLVMASLLQEFNGKIDLIYIDPPFDVGADFRMEVPIGEAQETTQKDQSTLEMVAYNDTWGKNLESYLNIMSERFMLMKDMLSENGVLFVHCDWHVNYYLRSILDELFGKENHLNEIIWYYYNKMHDLRKHVLPRAHDVIISYAKSKQSGYFYNQLKENRDEPVKQLVRKKVKGKMINQRDENGNVMYRSSEDRTVDDVWKIPMIQPADKTQNTGYKTQKNDLILERIISTFSAENAIVADLFCGSGTTGAVAERLNRKWIMCDLGRFAIHTSRKRLIELQRKLNDENHSYRAFDVYNLGRYERQWWQKNVFVTKNSDLEHRRVVLDFFRAEVFESEKSPSPLVHGRKGTALCHVDGIDSIFTRDEAKEVAKGCAASGGKEIYCLAWEFEMDLRLAINALETELGVKLKLVQIPREIMERNRTSPPPFLEVAVLEAAPVYHNTDKGRSVDIKLTKFLPSLAEVPSRELEAIKERAVKSGFDFIDFWAVDFNWRTGEPFNHNWQDYRTRKDRTLRTVSNAEFKYDKPGKYNACIKVIDIFGCDTSIVVEVNYV